MKFPRTTTCSCLLLIYALSASSQTVLETGGTKMPDEWIDRDTGHRIKRISRIDGSNLSFYFHNNPFTGNKMVFYNSRKNDVSDLRKQETYTTNSINKQLYAVDLGTLKATPLTHERNAMNGEILHNKSGNVYYQIMDTVYSVNVNTGKRSLIFVFPADFKASITTVNADGTLLAGARSTDEEKDIYRNNPEKKDYFQLIYEAHLPRTLFTIDIASKKLNRLFTDSAWLNHVQFSPTDPKLLMFCHEGPWHKVDRIWTINIETKDIQLMHKRTMDMEIAGHEWFGADGKKIWFDLQQPRGEKFFVANTDVKTLAEKKYAIERNEWSVHFSTSADEKLLCGDGGDPGAVAKAPDGQWIYLFRPDGDKLISTKLVNMKHHKYKLEPNVHFTPDGKWVLFRANFEGIENVYAVEIKAAH